MGLDVPEAASSLCSLQPPGSQGYHSQTAVFLCSSCKSLCVSAGTTVNAGLWYTQPQAAQDPRAHLTAP